MKPSTRALIFSLLIFPGAGLWVIGEKRRALFFILPTTIAFIFFITRLISIVQAIVDKAVKNLSINITSIYLDVHVKLMQDSYLQNIILFLVAIFIVSGIYSYFIGKQKEQEKALCKLH